MPPGSLNLPLPSPCVPRHRSGAIRLAYWALAFVAFTAGIVWLVGRPGSESVVRLPDGTEFRILGTSSGINFFICDPIWFRAARTILPKVWRGKIPTPQVGYPLGDGTGPESLNVYLLRTEGSGELRHFAPVDEEGFRMPESRGRATFGSASGGTLFGFLINTFPRRLPKFRISVYDDDQKEFGPFTIQNPFFQKFPEWTFESYPVTHTNGPVALTVSRIVLRPVQWDYHLYPEWKITSKDPLWVHAQVPPWRFRIDDATGNSTIVLPLSFAEKAWRLRTWVHRTRLEDFKPPEKLSFSHLPVPGPGQAILLDTRAEISGVQFQVWAFSGPGKFVVTNLEGKLLPKNSVGMEGQPVDGPSPAGIALQGPWRVQKAAAGQPPGRGAGTGLGPRNVRHDNFINGIRTSQVWSSPRPFLLLRTLGMAEHDALLAFVRDGGGNEIGAAFPPARFENLGPEQRIYCIDRDFPEGVTNVSIFLTVSKPIPFEFYVKPPKPPAAMVRLR
jgi:hypothetical protein